MTDYVSQIDNILETTNMVGRVTGALMASLTWWASSSLVYTSVQASRIFDDEDMAYSNLDDESKRSMADDMQARIDRLTGFIAWASSFCNADYLPSGEQIVTRFADQEPTATVTAETDEVQAHAELMGLTYEEAEQDFQANAEQRRQQMLAMQKLAHLRRNQLESIVDEAINAFPPDHLDIDDQLAQRLGDRMAAKLEQYDKQRRQQAAATIRERRKRTLASERRLIQNACDAADKLASMAEQAIESQRNEEIDHAS
jgi:hypothetical protein